MSSKQAVLLDRDGTINIDHGYVFTSDRLELCDGAAAAEERNARDVPAGLDDARVRVRKLHAHRGAGADAGDGERVRVDGGEATLRQRLDHHRRDSDGERERNHMLTLYRFSNKR